MFVCEYVEQKLSVAELKQLVSKPEVVEWVDCDARDPRLLVSLKAYRKSVLLLRAKCDPQQSLMFLSLTVLCQFLCTGQPNENTCPGNEVSRRRPSSYHVSDIVYFLDAIPAHTFSYSLDRRHRDRGSARRDQGEGGDNVVEAKDKRKGAAENGQDRH